MDGGRQVADASGAGQTVRLRTSMELGIEANRVRARHVLREGEQLWCALSWAEGLAVPEDLDDANRRLAATTRSGAPWLGQARFPDHRWREPIQRSALAIKGLTYMPTGAGGGPHHLAARDAGRGAQLGLPLHLDARLHPQALHWLNLDWEADEFMQFVADVEPNQDGALQIMYGIDGRRDLTETTRDDLSGYAGASPVRIGNGAFDQRQNDVYGAVLDSICSTPAASASGGCGRSCRPRRRAPSPCGASPTRASGRLAASRSIMCRPS